MLPSRKFLLCAAIFPCFAWSCLALLFFPDIPGWLAGVISLSWAAVAVAGIYRSRCAPRWLGVASGGTALIAIAHFTQSASDSRDWVWDQERTVLIRLSEEEAIIDNLRNTIYGEDGRIHSRNHYTDVFRFEDVESVDYVHEILSANGLVAHGFLTFAFSDGRRLAVSVEARRRAHHTYHPLRGLFRNYELIYIMGQETDLIGMRGNVRNNPVYVYPIRATRDEARGVFRSVLSRAESLGRHPEFYNTITNNCVTNILLHASDFAPESLRYDIRILLPGLADGLIVERGLVAFEGSRHEARQQFRINDRSRPFADPREWSEQIRQDPGKGLSERSL